MNSDEGRRGLGPGCLDFRHCLDRRRTRVSACCSLLLGPFQFHHRRRWTAADFSPPSRSVDHLQLIRRPEKRSRKSGGGNIEYFAGTTPCGIRSVLEVLFTFFRSSCCTFYYFPGSTLAVGLAHQQRETAMKTFDKTLGLT